MRHLFDCWHEVKERVRAAGSIALFLDFDGTLVRFQPRPEDVRLSHLTRRALALLASNPRVEVRIISGRRRSDIQMRTGVAGVQYLGLHGWENGRTPRLPPAARLLLEQAKETLVRRLEGMPGIRVEDKAAVLSVHYRGAANGYIAKARQAVDAALSDSPLLRAIPGRQVWEIMPRSIGNKGTAVEHVVYRLARHALPVYVGDDRTDEPAFAALSHGITIRVGRRGLTRARFQLRGPSEVRAFLEKLSGEMA